MINDLDIVQWAYLLDPAFQLVNSAGKPLTDGWLEVYIHGTRNKYYCASDYSGTLHPFKIPLDSLGANIVLASPAHSYDVYVYNRFGSLVMSRYNVVPATGDGSVIKDVVTITSDDGTVDVSTSDQTNWDLSIKNTVDTVVESLTERIAATGVDLQDQIDNKKDKQSPYSKSGSVTKTITSISQNENGEISVTYSDIDLPPEVPNVDLTSPSGTIDIQTDVDVGSNTKTFKIDVKKSNMQYFDGYAGASHYEDRDPGSTFAFGCPMNNWREYKYEGDFITNNWQAAGNMNFLLKPGIYLVTATIRYAMTNASAANTDGYIRIATGSYDGLENGTRYKDWTHEYQMGENTIQMAFVRTVLDGGNYSYIGGNDLYFYPHLPYGVNYAQLDHLQIVKLDSVVGQGGGSGSNTVVTSSDHSVEITVTTVGDTTTYDLSVDAASGAASGYTAGDAIDITNDTINVKVDPASGIDIVDDKLVVKVGEGLSIDPVSGLVIINSVVSDVVQTVEKLQDDLDKKITTTYPFAQITSMSDFAQYGVTNTTRMIGQLFAVPIASEIRKDETLLCVNALQNFSGNVSFGIFEYDFEGNGGTGSTYWIADTGTVSVRAGENEFPLKYVLNDAHEMQSSKLYYAVIAVAANAPATGLLLGSSPAYAQNVNANPKYTLIVSNMNQAIDWSTGTLQGAWFQGYNEQYDIPRLFMMLRNGEGSTPIPVTEPFTNISSFTLQHQYRVSDIFSLTPDAEGGVYRKVIPAQDVDIASFRYVDYHGSVPHQTSFPVLLDDTYTPIKSIGNGTWTLGDNDGTKIDGTHRVHEFTFTTPVHLTANTAYWFMVGGKLSDQGSDWLITYQTPTVTNDLLLVKNMYNVNSWIIPNNGEFMAAQPGMYLQLSDGIDSWTI